MDAGKALMGVFALSGCVQIPLHIRYIICPEFRDRSGAEDGGGRNPARYPADVIGICTFECDFGGL